MSTVIELRTTSVAPTGEAVGHHEVSGERRAVLVQGGAPNETVRVRVDLQKRPARAEIAEMIEPSSERVPAPCKYVTACGGCDWMHLSRSAQRAHHIELASTLAPGITPTFRAAKQMLGHRVRARFHIDAGVGVGFFGARSHDLVCVETCIALDPRLDAARADLGKLFEGARGHGDISAGLGRVRPVIEVRWSRELPASVYGRLDAAVRDRFQGIRIWCGESKRPSVFGDPTPWLAGADGEPLELGPGGFSQPHAEVNVALATLVAERAGDAKRVVELYAGAGNLTVLLAPRRELRAIESSEEACSAARRNLEARGLDAKVTCGDAALFDVPKNTDLLVLDPPRTGAREVCERLVASSTRVKRILYVSCDRATLGRDLRLLEPKYRVASLDVFEMFPQTSHAEIVATLERR